jgi:hypothetical protein
MTQIASRESALAALAARLTSQLSDVTVERGRRSPIDADETLPIIVLVQGGHEEQEPDAVGTVLMRCTAQIEAYVSAATDAALETAINALHARCAAAIIGIEIAYGSIGDSVWVNGQSFTPEAGMLAAADAPIGGFTWTISFDIRAPQAGGPYTTA